MQMIEPMHKHAKKDLRGLVTRGDTLIRALHYRVMISQPKISWNRTRTGTLNGAPYEFAVTQDPGNTKKAYAYFLWDGEVLYFATGTTLLDHDEAIAYAPAQQAAA